MTTIITRLYPDTRAANAAAAALKAAGMPASMWDVIAGSDAAAKMTAARVGKSSAAAYAPRIERGNALLVARAQLTPLGYARTVMDILDGFDAIHVPGATPEEYIREKPDDRHYLSVLTDHPRFFSQDIQPGSGRSTGLVSRAFGIPLLTRKTTSHSAMTGTRHMSRLFWPWRLLSPRRTSTSAIRGGKLITEAMGLPTVSQKNGPI